MSPETEQGYETSHPEVFLSEVSHLSPVSRLAFWEAATGNSFTGLPFLSSCLNLAAISPASIESVSVELEGRREPPLILISVIYIRGL